MDERLVDGWILAMERSIDRSGDFSNDDDAG
jgi:hypothetical protein